MMGLMWGKRADGSLIRPTGEEIAKQYHAHCMRDLCLVRSRINELEREEARLVELLEGRD